VLTELRRLKEARNQHLSQVTPKHDIRWDPVQKRRQSPQTLHNQALLNLLREANRCIQHPVAELIDFTELINHRLLELLPTSLRQVVFLTIENFFGQDFEDFHSVFAEGL
jgi:hypothetical protein